MSRVQLLYDLVRDLRTVADDVQAIADALTQNDDIPALPEHPTLPQTTYRDAVQNIILSYGVATFSELPESEYADILKKAEEIEHAA